MSSSNGRESITARLVLHRDNRGWILEKIAYRLVEHLADWGVAADISDEPTSTADINHWVLFMHCRGRRWPGSTMTITHIERPSHYWNVMAGMKVVDVGICMSRMTVDYLANRGVSREKLCYITPAHDGIVSPKRITIGITTRVYADGRKREDVLCEVAKVKRLDAFHFEIFGAGWEQVIPILESAGATVAYFPGSENYERDYEITLEHLGNFDYYLYLGWDEGSMGFLDALAAGVATIVTPQGYHLDVPGGITHSFKTADDLGAVFDQISRERNSYIDSVKDLTWNDFARRHALVWRAVLQGGLSAMPADDSAGLAPLPRESRFQRIVADTGFYGRPALKRLRNIIKKTK